MASRARARLVGGGAEDVPARAPSLPGGRAALPSRVEDVVEFLITEGLAVPRDERWEDVLRAEREAFQRIQLHAAIRRDPDAGREVLKDLRIS